MAVYWQWCTDGSVNKDINQAEINHRNVPYLKMQQREKTRLGPCDLNLSAMLS